MIMRRQDENTFYKHNWKSQWVPIPPCISGCIHLLAGGSSHKAEDSNKIFDQTINPHLVFSE